MSNFFSIVIPCYEMKGKGVEFLDFSLSKIASQSFKNFEVVISDHSISSDIEDLCKKYESLEIRYFKNNDGRGSSSSNINNGIKNSRGKWIKILFQDDFLFSNDSLENIYNFIQNSQDPQWIATACEHSQDGQNFYRTFIPRWNNKIHFGNNTVSSPSVIIFRNNFDENIFFDEKLINLMDVDFYKRMFDLYGEPFYLNDVCVVNRTWDGQVSNQVSEELHKNELSIVSSKYRNVDLFFEKLVNLEFPTEQLYGFGIVDINEHLNTLKRYARSCEHVTEMGTRKAISTIALLAASPKKVVSIDLNYHLFQPVENTIRQISKECNTEFQFIEADVLQIEIEETDFLFIDTFHTYHQLLSELRRHEKNVKKWIALHDTVTFGLKDENVYQNANISRDVNVSNKTKEGIYNALVDFLTENKNWKIKEHFTNNNGLTIIERIKN
jgi:glycosyltransferase involved in cell wall biosynthesis